MDDKTAAALSVAARYVPDSRKCVFETLGTPISKLKYAMKFMPHGEDYQGPFHLRSEDAEAFELANRARIRASR